MLSNSLKFTFKGFIKLKFSLKEENKPRYIRILKGKVTDSGIGIKENVIPTLFQEFRMAEDSQKYNKSGKAILMNIKEVVWVSSFVNPSAKVLEEIFI